MLAMGTAEGDSEGSVEDGEVVSSILTSERDMIIKYTKLWNKCVEGRMSQLFLSTYSYHIAG
jgi:hypothetical protein